MKKYLLGLIALVMAFGLSAFTAPPKSKKMPFDVWWFVVKPGWGIASGFSNNMVDYHSTADVMPQGVCMVFPWTYKCVIGFDAVDVNAATNMLHPGTRYPIYVAEKRPNP